MTTAGSIESLTLKSRIFPVTADTEAQRKLGGFENEVQANGDGTSRIIKTRVAPKLGEFMVSTDDARDDQEFLQDLADLKDFFPIVVTYASGISYQGRAMITGEIQTSSQSGATAITLEGTGTFTRQA
jgi:hypothetical protein